MLERKPKPAKMMLSRKAIVGVAVLFVASLFLLISFFPDKTIKNDDFFHQAKQINDDQDSAVVNFEKDRSGIVSKIEPQNLFKDNQIDEDVIPVDGNKIKILISHGKSNDKVVVTKIPVLLLHGAAFNSKTWQDLGTIQFLAKQGYNVIAVDLPGYGKSVKGKTEVNNADFLDHLITELALDKPVIVSPSMSGSFSIPYLFKYGEKMGGFVPVAPVIPAPDADFSKISVPTFIVSGSLDPGAPQKNEILSKIPNSSSLVIEKAKHPCYLDNPELFHNELLKFLKSIK
uniref:Alpha/beta hydrolase domain-containing protein 14B-like n=1 Tax=Phallusia mammillata TaxID=59560 RepID=A0A6F9D636_9ASCI|nr:alpha/beta hydrolase domain-containing protein 14B-like [Phallusia mammillata]